MRIVKGESFTKGRSRCPKCNHVLSAKDLIPLISWISTKGKCRYCGESISRRYPVTEMVMAVCSVLCLLCCDYSLLCLRNWLFVCCLFLISLVDLDSMEIPDGALIASVIIWGVFLIFLPEPLKNLKEGLISALVFGGGVLLISLFLDKILQKETLGGGDVKLIAVSGLYLGLAGNLFMVFLACIIGLVLMPVLKKMGDNEEFPFGPSIAASTFIMLLCGNPLVNWYLSLF